jgi:RNA polymerase sigma-70 factor (ECF subfamily)
VYEADRALVSRMRGGEQRAFDEFFKATMPRLVAYVTRRSDLDPDAVEDIVQCALIKAVRNLAGYRGEAALFTWLTEICRHEMADEHRKVKRRPVHVSLDEPLAFAKFESQLRVAANQELTSHQNEATHRERVIKVLNKLPANYATALEAKYGDGLSVEAVAQELGVSVTAAQSVLARAREAFRQGWMLQSRKDDAWT